MIDIINYSRMHMQVLALTVYIIIKLLSMPLMIFNSLESYLDPTVDPRSIINVQLVAVTPLLHVTAQSS